MAIRHDYRSDTVTRPTLAMRAAMLDAAVGDDVFGEDPTVALLEQVAAERLGKETGLLFPSGTQANLAAIMAHCGRGEEYLVGQMAHCYRWEGGGAAVIGSVQPQPIVNQPDGSIALDDISAAIKPDDPHFARTRLLALENSFHGKVLPDGYTAKAIALARTAGLATHLDGARLFNAAVASGRSVAELAAGFDTVSICLSKGLGAPIGSVLVGEAATVMRARRLRKMLGGGMRQAGILAAAGLYALDQHVARLADDHVRARRLARGLAQHPELAVDTPDSNIVMAHGEIEQLAALASELAQNQIMLMSLYGGTCHRWVVHLDIDDAAIDAALATTDRFFARAAP